MIADKAIVDDMIKIMPNYPTNNYLRIELIPLHDLPSRGIICPKMFNAEPRRGKITFIQKMLNIYLEVLGASWGKAVKTLSIRERQICMILTYIWNLKKPDLTETEW